MKQYMELTANKIKNLRAKIILCKIALDRLHNKKNNFKLKKTYSTYSKYHKQSTISQTTMSQCDMHLIYMYVPVSGLIRPKTVIFVTSFWAGLLSHPPNKHLLNLYLSLPLHPPTTQHHPGRSLIATSGDTLQDPFSSPWVCPLLEEVEGWVGAHLPVDCGWWIHPHRGPTKTTSSSPWFGCGLWMIWILEGRPLDVDVDPRGSTSPAETLNFGCVCG